MPNFRQHGNQDYIFGFDDPAVALIAAAIGLKPQSASIAIEPEFTAEAKNEDGMTDGKVVGDPKKTVTLNGFITDDELFDGQGTAFNLNGDFYIVEGRKKDTSNTDFKKGEITAVSYPLITS
jgi:hypothetical protein